MSHLTRHFIILIALPAAICLYSCSKDNGPDPAAIVGKWQYDNSTLDTVANGQWRPPVTIYDSTFTADVGESLEFRKGDTVYYSYKGVTTWSNYAVKGHDLILIGSAASDTLTIHMLSTSQLQIGTDDGATSWWANFTRLE
jgi:hypothetical protein